MRKTLAILAFALLALTPLAAQNKNANANANSNTTNANGEMPKKKRGPVFSANKEQKEKAQGILKQRGFYAGEITGKLDDDTRAGLKKYQEAEGIKVTGTLNAPTLEKMKLPLTDKQKETLEKQKAFKEGKM